MPNRDSFMGFLLPHACTITVILIVQIEPAFAYLDPGTGSIILQGLIGVVAASVTVITLYYQKFKDLFRRIFHRSDRAKTSTNKSTSGE